MIKGPIVDIDNRFNKEFALGSRLIDIFHSCFSFHYSNKQSNESIKLHICHLNNIAIKSSSDLSYALVISNTSIKNNVVTSITHIYVHDKSIIKTIHHMVNITSTEAELFAIRYGINQAIIISGISKIIVITDSIHTTRRIFDSSSHLLYAAAISTELRKFFTKNYHNSIEF